MSNLVYEYEELITFHPGYYVKDYIEELGINQEEFAKRLQVTPKYVSDLVNGRIMLTGETALKLATVIGTSVDLWLNLNKSFIVEKLEIDRRKQLQSECDMVRALDYSFWSGMGVVRTTRNAEEKVAELQRYFRVNSLNVLKERDFLVQYRRSVSKVTDANIINANAWVQTALNIGVTIETEPFSAKKLRKVLPEIRSMTTKSPECFYERLKGLLAASGVALVFLPNLKNCGVNGAVKWLGKDKVVLALNDRRKYADVFWFALFHELGHVLQKRLKNLFVSEDAYTDLAMNDAIIRLEREADEFSQNTLIPQKEYKVLVDKKIYTAEAIESFAHNIGIHPGIVVGRLQRDRYVSYKSELNHMKSKYEIVV